MTTTWDPHAPRSTRTTYINGEEMKRRSGKFLTKKFHASGMPRKEAVARLGISEGYLTGLLAGRVILPSPEVLDNMSRHWGFPKIEYMVEVGLLNSEDVADYITKMGIAPAYFPAKIQMLVGKLIAIEPPEKRDQITDTLGTLLVSFGVE
jgi:hypothetical protein